MRNSMNGMRVVRGMSRPPAHSVRRMRLNAVGPGFADSTPMTIHIKGPKNA